ncbi:hypothetical protein PTSG_12202 [Salpingoeca rosetta]|uniref:Retrovirus-related Pol polyprotein from transposon TNT 1-94 n=1 Tax=Salpingoeca rosetta (strain ATCC 50818 / BSB-021) TaxID=946362 RepID=F2U860_SALR5|nr:uncharacterized protein PTSG_12202 [Salpingoeca rosetta]EGD72965.1 hypothetical protein PTSG_12202 [Salpingoeca rosetta]|eukprot:XP_004994787.1 hypothetical protein PTSG_12202 [Salpingoeca rosetta]
MAHREEGRHMIPVLDGNKVSYSWWSMRMRHFLKRKKVWGVVDPDSEETDEVKNSDAYLWITEYLTGFPMKLVHKLKGDEDENARAAWKTLAKMYERKDKVAMVEAKIKMFNRQWERDDTVESFVNDFMETHENMTRAGGDMSEEDLIQLIIVRLPEKYRGVKTVLRLTKDLTIQDMMHALKSEEDMTSLNDQRAGHVKERVAKVYEKPRRDSKPKGRKEERRCFFCNKPGHLKRDCREWKRERQKKFKGPRQHSGEKMFSLREEEEMLCSIREEVRSTRTDTKATQGAWLLDSGASRHVTSFREDLTDVKETDTAVTVADGRTVKALGQGTAHIHTSAGRVVLSDVLLMPEGFERIISQRRVVQRGHQVRSNKDGDMEIKFSNGKKLTLSTIGGMSYLIDDEHEVVKVLSSTSKTALQELHELFAHRDSKKIRENVCDTCLKSKMKRKSMPQHSGRDNQQYKKGQMLVADIAGPYPTSLHGGRYALVMKEVRTGFVMVGVMENKGEAAEVATRLILAAPRQLGVGKGSTIKTDNERVFTSTAFSHAMYALNITTATSAPYTPERNGDAERTIQTLNNMARAMLQAASLGEEFWAAALRYAAYLNNFLGPFRNIFGRNPPMTHLQQFGVTAYVRNEARKSKMAPRTTEAIYVGYDERSRSHLLWEPGNRRLTRSIHVKFLTMDESRVRAIVPLSTPAPTFTSAPTPKRTTSALPHVKKGAKTAPKVATAPNAEVATPKTRATKKRGHGKAPRSMRKETALGETSAAGKTTESSSAAGEETTTFDAPITDTTVTRTTAPSTSNVIPEERNSVEGEGRMTVTRSIPAFTAAPRRSARIKERQKGEEVKAVKVKKGWEEAVAEEMSSLERHDVWDEAVEGEYDVKPLNTRFVYATKGDGRRKARLVVMGNMEPDGNNGKSNYSPTASRTTTLTFLALNRARVVRQLDIKTAFLHAPIQSKKPVLVRGPDGKVYRLKRALYGLRRSPQDFNKHLHQQLQAQGWRRATQDMCVYLRGRQQLLVFVDDLLVAADTADIADQIENELRKRMEIKRDKGGCFVGVEYSLHKGQLRAHANSYIDSLHLDRVNTHTPLTTDHRSATATGLPEKETDADSRDEFHAMVGRLTYIASTARPDIAYAVSVLGEKCQSPTAQDQKQLQRTAQYVETHRHELRTTTTSNEIRAFADASYACEPESRSRTGVVLTIGGLPVFWSSKRQKMVCLSTSEAEYVSMTEAAKQAIWVKNLCAELGQEQESVTIYTDSQSAIALAQQQQLSPRTKHLGVRMYFLRQQADAGNIKLAYLKTTQQPADLLTKALGKRQHQLLTSKIMKWV